MDMSVPELETDIRAVGEFETAPAESTSGVQYNNTNINFDGLSEQQRSAELEALGISDEPFDLDAFLNQTETPPPPPRPTVETIQDEYFEELESDFVIEETTLDDFEPWEPPPPPPETKIRDSVEVKRVNEQTKIQINDVSENIGDRYDLSNFKLITREVPGPVGADGVETIITIYGIQEPNQYEGTKQISKEEFDALQIAGENFKPSSSIPTNIDKKITF